MSAIIRHFGTKRETLDEILRIIPYHTTFVDVFGGSGAVIFNKELTLNNIYNDLNKDFYNFFCVYRDNPDELLAMLKRLICSRDQFMEYKTVDFSEPVKRAALFWYNKRVSYLGLGLHFNIEKFPLVSNTFLQAYNKFLEKSKKMVFENKPFQKIIKKYDKDTTLFYADPPYVALKKEEVTRYDVAVTYGQRYSITADKWDNFEYHKELADILKNIKGMFILSYNSSDKIRELYQDFHIKEIIYQSVLNRKQVGQSARSGKKIKELLIWNF